MVKSSTYLCGFKLIALLCTLSFYSCASPLDFSTIYQQVNQSVVVVQTETSRKIARSAEESVETSQRGIGTGVIISDDGKILTAAHVIQSADKITVDLVNGDSYPARVLSSSKMTDLAMIQLIGPDDDLPVASLGDSDQLRIGEPIFVIGTPYGSEQTLTTGILSARRQITLPILNEEVEFLQTDAAINQGNSGGPVFNMQGQVIGIVSYIKSQSGGNEGLGFAVSINVAKQRIINKPPFWAGMDVVPLEGNLARALNVPHADGLLVQDVANGSIAQRMGLRGGSIPMELGGETILLGGDIIIRINDKRLAFDESGVTAIFTLLQGLQPGDRLSMLVIREGGKKELSIRL